MFVTAQVNSLPITSSRCEHSNLFYPVTIWLGDYYVPEKPWTRRNGLTEQREGFQTLCVQSKELTVALPSLRLDPNGGSDRVMA